MDLLELQSKIDEFLDYCTEKNTEWQENIEDHLKSGKYHYVEIDTGGETPVTRFLTDAPVDIIKDCDEEYDDWDNFAKALTDQGFGIMWDDTLDELFGEEAFEKYVEKF